MLVAFDAVCARSATCAAHGTPTSDRIDCAPHVAAADARAGDDHRPRRQCGERLGRPVEPALAVALGRDRLDRLPRARRGRGRVARGRPAAAHQAAHPRPHDHEHRLARDVLGRGGALGDLLRLPDGVRRVPLDDRPAVRHRPGRGRAGEHASRDVRPWTVDRVAGIDGQRARRVRHVACLRRRRSARGARNPRFPDVPTLVLAGDLDTLTPPGGRREHRGALPGRVVRARGELRSRHGSRRRMGLRVDDRGRVHHERAPSATRRVRAPFPRSGRSTDSRSTPTDATEATAAPGDASTPLDRQIATLAVAEVGGRDRAVGCDDGRQR